MIAHQFSATGNLPPNHTGVTRFKASDGVCTLATVPLSFQNRAPWSIEVWFSLDALVDFMPLVGKNNEFTLATKGRTLYAAFANQLTPLQSAAVLETATPYYVSVIYDGQNMTLNLNGVVLAQATANVNPPASGNPLQIGGGFYGEIQGFRCWNYAVNVNTLSDNQWTDFPSGSRGLLAQVDFTVWPPLDSSGNGIMPSFSGSVAFAPFVPSVVLETSAFSDPYNDNLVNPGGDQTPFSVSAWICPYPIGDLMYIFTNGVAESNSGMTLAVNAAGNVEFQVGNGPTLTSESVLQNGAWVNIAVTWSNNVGTLYINGTQDSTATNMGLAGMLAAGEPLIGAIASIGAQLPIASFQGFVQNVGVWKIALTAQQVTQYMTSSPQLDPNCLAAYDLSASPAQNLVSLNPTGLVAGAALLPTPVGVSSYVPFQRPLARPAPLALALHAGQNLPGATLATTLGGTAFLQQQVQDFDKFLGALPLSADQRAAFKSQFDAKLRQGQTDFLAGKLQNHMQCRIDALPNGVNRLVHLAADGEHIVYEGTLSQCTLWCIQLVAAIVGALFTALGFALNYSKWLNGFTTFLGTRINSVGIMPQLAALFNNGVTSTGIYQAIKLLQEYSLLVPLAKLSWGLLSSAVSWWTILSVGIRILLIVSPAAPLEIAWFVAQLAYSIYSIAQIISQKPAGCPGSSQAVISFSRNTNQQVQPVA
ncbi:hypothetical protein WK59_06575 [Burkholderia ubonensis]|uniref:LamG domain-containing protein n=1 Tax=Burkholderia ubonensis TaxID=101571 RepID=UPI00075DEAEB|nr:LamG-like jellyroll fold domain-containing protein [Burkholderia ubonensis]KVO02068.1 hypothetical protein WJ71_18770 [Burkholderia ubonensis]KVO11277.1 hypothetical protein WJ73_20480 [Burkholderia ubonensis]KVT89173.1 hypothetical protein WK59_06575 [Burkholderia ubonensis]KVU00184.1 hypothetical protein WK60_01055 [Burkholderia ubonensis]